MTEIEQYAAQRTLLHPSVEGRQAAEKALLRATPVSSGSTLPELLCAAWELKQRDDLWQSRSYMLEIWPRLLNELVLKSAEVMEYWHRESSAA
jgi:hypothetical protein